MTDPLAPLLELAGVPVAVKAAQDAVFDVHRLPANLRDGSASAAEAAVRAARASAAIEGADARLPDGPVTDPLLTGALRVAQALESLLPTWRRAPLQVLARMHMLAATDLVSDRALGKPRGNAGVGPRLDLLAQLVTGATSVPGPVLTAVVHGELLALRPFGSADGIVARAAARLTMIATGVDPKALSVPEVAYFRRSKRYTAVASGFATGTNEGLREWLIFSCEALEIGAREAKGVCDTVG